MSTIYRVKVAPAGSQPVGDSLIYQVYGRTEFEGAGESTFSETFPVAFQVQPSMYHGGELAPGQVLVPTKFPVINVLVASWQTRTVGATTYFTGAEFVLVATGPADMKATALWQIEGYAIPVTDLPA
jgi:hypothetical protein